MNKIQEHKFGLSERDVQTILDIFSGYPAVKLVHIFGSRAKGTWKTGSDIDLAIMNKGVDDKTLSKLRTDFEESSLPYKIDLVNYPDLRRQEFKDHIDRVGKIFYKRSGHGKR